MLRDIIALCIAVAGIVIVALLIQRVDQKLDAHAAASEKQVKNWNDTQEAMIWVIWACRGQHAANPECEQLNLASPAKLREMQKQH